MGINYNPRTIVDGLVLALDAANTKNYNLTAVEVLVVAGGGGGGNHHGGGGGAGGLIYSSIHSITPGSAITVTVGAGGAATSYGGGNGGNGGNSVFDTLTAIGGGGGGSYPNNGSSGGSGGGSNNWSTSTTGGTGTSGQGFAGGSNNGTTNYGGGGGGAGGTAKGLSNNSGGDGLPFNISGTVTYYSGGGGSGVYPGYTNDTSYGYGGLGGGGNGGNGPHGSGTAPTAGGTNTGGGGGGVADLYQNSAAGGSGIVIVRYPGPQKAIGGTITSNNGYTIHTFTTVGSTTFTPLVATNNSAILGLSDFSGNNNFGTAVNGPTYSTANGGSLSFDGTDDYILGTIPSSTFSGAHSICCWFYRETVTEWAGLFSNNVNTTSCSIFTFITTSNSLGTNQAGVDGTSIAVDLGADHLNKWIYAVITYAGSTNGSAVNVYAYKDGSLLTATGSLYWNLSSSSSYYIGRHWTSGSQILDGFIPQVSIYNRALTAAEVSQNYNALRGRYGI
jgi:hypothetical protein